MSDRKLANHRWCNVEGTLGMYVNSASGTNAPNAVFMSQASDDGSQYEKCVLVATSRILKRDQILVPNYMDTY